MPDKSGPDCPSESFTRSGRHVEIRNLGDRVELAIDRVVYPVRFLENGRPFTSAYVNAMAKNVRDYAEKFIDFTEAQEAHWAELEQHKRKESRS